MKSLRKTSKQCILNLVSSTCAALKQRIPHKAEKNFKSYVN